MAELVDLQKQEIEALRERVRQLERLLIPEDVTILPEWGLVNSERRCFAALTTRDIVSKEYLFAALYGEKPDSDQPTEQSVVESHVSKMRKKLRLFGITVTSDRFVGYSLTDRKRFIKRGACE